MAVPEGPTDKRYTGNGVTKIFTIPFLLLAATDLDVYIDGIEISSGFAITNVGNPTSTITFTVAPVDQADIYLQLNVPFERLNDYQENGDFLSSTVNRDFDRIWQALKQLFRWSTRSLRLGNFDVDGAGWYRAKGNGIRDLKDPVEAQDATTKRYVQALIAEVLETGQGPINNASNIAYVFPDLSIHSVQKLSDSSNPQLGSAGIGHIKPDNSGDVWSVSDELNRQAHTGAIINLADPIFGLRFDGTDETIAIQALVNLYKGSWISFGQKVATVKSIIWPSGSRAFSMRFKTLAGSQDFVAPITVDGSISGKTDYIFWDVWVDGNRQAQSSIVSPTEDGGRHGFRFLGGVTDVYLYRCKANYCGGDGFEFFSVTPSLGGDGGYRFLNICMIDCEASWNRRHGFSADSCFNFVVRNYISHSNGRDLNATSPLNHGMRGARFNNNLYGRPFDFEDYGIGTAYRNITIDGVQAYGNIAGPLFHSSTDVNDARFVPRENIFLSDIVVGPAEVTDNNSPSLSFYSETASVAKPAFINIVANNCRFYAHLALVGVKGLTFQGRLQRTISGRWACSSVTSSEIRIDAQGDRGSSIFFDVQPYPITAVKVTPGMSLPLISVEVQDTYPSTVIKIAGTFIAASAGVTTFKLRGADNTYFSADSISMLRIADAMPIATAANADSTSGVNVFSNIPTAGEYAFSVVAKVGGIYT